MVHHNPQGSLHRRQALLAQDRVVHSLCIEDAQEHGFALLGHLRRGIAPVGTGFDQGLPLVLGTIPDTNLMTGIQQAAHHRLTHTAQTTKTNIHVSSFTPPTSSSQLKRGKKNPPVRRVKSGRPNKGPPLC